MDKNFKGLILTTSEIATLKGILDREIEWCKQGVYESEDAENIATVLHKLENIMIGEER